MKLREQGMGNLDELGNDVGHQILTASCPGVDNRWADNRTLSVIKPLALEIHDID